MATVPYISLQPTYPQVFTDIAQALVPQEKVWISIYHADRPSLHSKLVLEPVVESSRPSSSRRDGEGAEPAVEEEEWMKSQGGVGIAPAEEGLIDVSRVPGAQVCRQCPHRELEEAVMLTVYVAAGPATNPVRTTVDGFDHIHWAQRRRQLSRAAHLRAHTAAERRRCLTRQCEYPSHLLCLQEAYQTPPAAHRIFLPSFWHACRSRPSISLRRPMAFSWQAVQTGNCSWAATLRPRVRQMVLMQMAQAPSRGG